MSLPRTWSSYLHQALLFLLHLLVVTTPFFFTWINEELFEFNKMLLVYGIVWSMLGLWAAQVVIEKKLTWRKTTFDIPLALFILSQLLSTALSIHPRTSWLGYYTRFHGGLLSTITYAGLYWTVVQNFNWRELRNVMKSAVLAGLGACLYALPEHFGHSPSCVLISGGMNWGVDCWLQDVQSRIFGTFGQPNWLAAYSLMLIPFSIAFLWNALQEKTRSVLKVSLYSATTVALLATLWFTKSRSGLLGLAGMGGVMILWLGSWFARKKQWSVVGGISLMLLVASVLGGNRISSLGLESLGCFVQPDTFFTELRQQIVPDTNNPTNSLEAGGTESGVIRCIVWTGAIRVWQRYPLFGSGVETFAYSYYQDRPVEHNYVSEWDFLYNKAHNEFLNFLATTGIIGLSAYLLLLGWCGVQVGKKLVDRNSSTQESMWSIASGTAIVGLTISNFFGFSTVMVTILMYLCFSILALVGQPEQKVPIQRDNHLAAWQIITLVIISIGVLFSVNICFNWWSADALFTRGKQELAQGYTSDGLTNLENTTLAVPDEALFSDELARTYAQVAVALANQGEASAAAEFSHTAQLASNRTITLNNRHLNYYKSRVQTYLLLSQLDPQLVSEATRTLEAAIDLSPTDAKLRYNLGFIKQTTGELDEAMANYRVAIELKPNYVPAYISLAEIHETKQEWAAAAKIYDTVLNTLAPQDTALRTTRQALDASISATLH